MFAYASNHLTPSLYGTRTTQHSSPLPHLPRLHLPPHPRRILPAAALEVLHHQRPVVGPAAMEDPPDAAPLVAQALPFELLHTEFADVFDAPRSRRVGEIHVGGLVGLGKL